MRGGRLLVCFPPTFRRSLHSSSEESLYFPLLFFFFLPRLFSLFSLSLFLFFSKTMKVDSIERNPASVFANFHRPSSPGTPSSSGARPNLGKGDDGFLEKRIDKYRVARFRSENRRAKMFQPFLSIIPPPFSRLFINVNWGNFPFRLFRARKRMPVFFLPAVVASKLRKKRV